MSDALIRAEAVTRVYRTGEVVVDALREIDLVVERGEFTAIAGPSGSGKSTLMNTLGCLDTPSSGRFLLNGNDVSGVSDDQLAEIRSRQLGLILSAETA